MACFCTEPHGHVRLYQLGFISLPAGLPLKTEPSIRQRAIDELMAINSRSVDQTLTEVSMLGLMSLHCILTQGIAVVQMGPMSHMDFARLSSVVRIQLGPEDVFVPAAPRGGRSWHTETPPWKRVE